MEKEIIPFADTALGKAPVSITEREILRITLAEYLAAHGPKKGTKMSPNAFSDYASSFVRQRPPSKSAIEGFINGDTDTSARTVRIIRHILLESGFLNEFFMQKDPNLKRLVTSYVEASGVKVDSFYGRSAKLVIDPVPNLALEIDICFHWKIDLIGDLYILNEYTPDFITRTGPHGYAAADESGSILGYVVDKEFGRLFRLQLIFERAAQGDSFKSILKGYMSKVADSNKPAAFHCDVMAKVEWLAP